MSICLYVYTTIYYPSCGFDHKTPQTRLLPAATGPQTEDNSQLQAHAPGITFRFSTLATERPCRGVDIFGSGD